MLNSKVIAAMPILFLAGLAQAQPAAGEKVLFEAKFTDKLDKDWAWVREEPRAWRLENGALVTRTLPGYLHAMSNNSRNVLLRPLPKSDKPLAVEVHVEGEPKVQFEHAGVIWYSDDDNYVSLFQEVLGKKVQLQMVTEREGKPSFAVARHDNQGVWLRLVIAAGTITTKYRPAEKADWKTVDSCQFTAAMPRVGVTSGGAPKDAERYVRFRGFRILELAK